MALTFQSAISPLRQGIGQRLRRVPHHLRTFLAVYHERGYSYGSYQSGWQRPEDRRFVDQGVRHSFKRWPERGISHLSHDSGWYAYCLGLEKLDCVAAATRRDELGELGSELSRLSSCWRWIV
jgi:hypothetical protein